MRAATDATDSEKTVAAELREFFYPIHYQIGMAFEDALRGSTLTRKQCAILWMIRSEGRSGKQMRRKEIVRLMQSWFEVTGSALSKAIRGMARPPLGLVQVTEDPGSAREKIVSLTPKGEQFIGRMAVRGEQFLLRIVRHLTPGAARSGREFFAQFIAAFKSSRGSDQRPEPGRPSLASPIRKRISD
jgi:DNA-binding MarR family transcriptional regulator